MVAAQPATAEKMSIRRRPRRSASAMTASEKTTPMRTAARAPPWARSSAPNSSAAKVMVWVMRVPR